MTQWLRLWHDMPTDPKWRVIARRSGQRIGDVIAVYNLMLVAASSADDRGSLEAWDDEDAGACLDLDGEAVASIRAAMVGKVIEGDRLSGWEKRQPKREDGSSDRVRAFRDRKKAESAVTPDDETGVKRDETQRNAPEQSRTEQRREEGSEAVASAPAEPSAAPDFRKELFGSGLASVKRQTGRGDGSCRALLGKALSAANDDARIVLTKVMQAEADGVADLGAWLLEAVKPKTPPPRRYSRPDDWMSQPPRSFEEERQDPNSPYFAAI